MTENTIQVNVKWNGKKFDNLTLNLNESGSVFKAQLFSLTGVEPERQKILVKGGQLKDDTNLSNLKLKSGHTFMMMGTPGNKALKEPAKKAKFIEDMTEAEINVVENVPSGLENLGNTCYMNSTLQCLRAIPELNETLHTFSGALGSDPLKNIAISMRDLFKAMDKSGTGIPPMVFLQMLRSAFPQFSQQDRMGGYMQQDAEECYSSLLNALGQSLKDDQGRSFIQKYMTGKMVSTMKCDECPEEEPTISTDEFQRLNCHISINVNFLNQGISEGMVEKIEKNSPALQRGSIYTKTAKVTRLPKYLTVSFVRFFWKQEQQVKAKIMRAVKFPLELDVFEFCDPKLQEKLKVPRETLKEQKDAIHEHIKKRKNAEDPHQDDKSFDFKSVNVATFDDIKDKIDDSLIKDEGCSLTGEYDLVSVLTHVGRSADSGHYIGWAKDQKSEDKWWKYDDDHVTSVKSEDILKLCGGGDWHMAYLLVYKSKTLA